MNEEGRLNGTGAVDISGLNYADLNELRGRIDARVTEMRETGGPRLLERFAQEAAELGLTIEESVKAGNGKRGRGRPRKPAQEAAAQL